MFGLKLRRICVLFWLVFKYFINCLFFGFNWNFFRRKFFVKMLIIVFGILMVFEIEEVFFLLVLLFL